MGVPFATRSGARAQAKSGRRLPIPSSLREYQCPNRHHSAMSCRISRLDPVSASCQTVFPPIAGGPSMPGVGSGRRVGRGFLRLVSYNLHEFVGRDGRIAPDLVRSALARLEADVIAVQEFQALRADISPFQSLGAWGRSLEMTPIAGFTLQRSGGHYGSAVLTRLPIRSVRRHDLSVAPHEPRGALEVHLEWGHATLRLFATHLGLRWRERRRQVRRLIRLLMEDSMPTLLMGDLNDWTPGSLQLRPLWRHLPQRSRAATFPARLPLLTLDCIAASADLPWRCSRTETGRPFRSISDHLPVVVEIGDDERPRPGTGFEAGPRRDAPTARTAPRPIR